MKKFFPVFFLVLLLAACSGGTAKEHYFLKLEQSRFPVQLWRSDGSHFKNTFGTLMVNNSPITGAEIQIGDKHVTTDQNGRFPYFIDQSQLSKKAVMIKNLDNAKLKGKKLDSQMKDKISNLKANILVYYPIKLISKAVNGEKIIIQAEAVTEGKADFATIKSDNQAIMGTIKDAHGNPVKGAIVSTTRSSGEGWAKSGPTNSNGEYSISLITEDDEDQTFRVTVNQTQYTLPVGRVFRFPEGSSLEINAILPAKGPYIHDAPPTLVSRTMPGRMYRGTIIGLAGVAPEDYHVTIPKEDGTFTITFPKNKRKGTLTFFEKQINQYDSGNLLPGDPVPSAWLKAPLSKEQITIPEQQY